MRRRRLPAEKPQTPRAFAVGSAVGGWGGSLIMTNPPGRCANASATDSAEGGGCKVRIRRISPRAAVPAKVSPLNALRTFPTVMAGGSACPEADPLRRSRGSDPRYSKADHRSCCSPMTGALANRRICPYLRSGAIPARDIPDVKSRSKIAMVTRFRPQRGPLMRLLVADVYAMTLGGAVNAASVQDDARQFFERFVTAQNAHDLPTVGSMLWNSEDFLWVTRGVQVRGSKTALNMFSRYYTGTWHLDPDMNQLKATALPNGTVQILVPVTFTRGEPGQAAQQATFLISQTVIRDPNGWHVATILPIADTHLK